MTKQSESDDAYWKQGELMLAQMIVEMDSIIGLFPEEKRKCVSTMMEGPIGEQFVMAPASTRRHYHNAFPCGLLAHSLGVVKNALRLSKALWPGRWPTWKVAFVALFHDLGKAGAPGKPFYVLTKEEWKRKKGEHWEVSKDEYMPNPERAIFTLLSHGVSLDYEEYQAIRLNDGAAAEGNKDFAFKENPLSLIVHWADHATMMDEKDAERESE
jgi:hypothetical protein